MNAQHTPGPWTVHERTGVYAADDTMIADCNPLALSEDCNTQANARLIKVAPEMLDVLEYIDKINGSTGGPKAMVDEFKFRARAVLAKIKEVT